MAPVGIVLGHRVEALDEGVLPRRPRLDVGGRRAHQPAPVPQRLGDELGLVVHAQMLRCSRSATRASVTATSSSASHGAAHSHGQRFAGVLIDDVAQLQPPSVRGLVELEVDGPDVVGTLGPEQLPAAGRTGSPAPTRRTPPRQIRSCSVSVAAKGFRTSRASHAGRRPQMHGHVAQLGLPGALHRRRDIPPGSNVSRGSPPRVQARLHKQRRCRTNRRR